MTVNMSHLSGAMCLQAAENLLEDPGVLQVADAGDDTETTISMIKSLPSYENSLIELKHRMQDLLASADEDQVLQLVNTLESGQDPSLSPDQLLAEPTSNTAVSSNSFNLRVAAPKDKNIRTLCRNRRAISPAESTTSSSSAASSLTLCARPVKHSVRSSEVRQDTRKINLLDDYLPVQYAVPIESQHKQETKVVPSERMARPTAQTFSDAESSFSSCLNQDGFTVMNPDQLFTLAAALDRQHSSLTNRQQALRQLVRLPINDVQACEAWAHILESEQPDSTASWMESKGPKGKPTQANRSSSFFGIPGQRGVVRSSRSDKPRDTTVCRPLKQPRAGGCLKQGLQDALNDEDGILWSLALRYVCKGLETSPPNIREPFILLIEHVQRLFTSNVERIPHLREDVNMALYPMDRALRACHLLNQFHRNICQFWIRYPEQFLNEVIEQTLNVLVLNRHHQGRWLTGTDFGQINPLCVSSMLDPHAEWFTKWMHGSYSRDPLIRHLRDDPSLVNYSLDIIMGFMNSTQRRTLQTNSFPKAGVDTQLIFSSEEILCALLIHSFSVIHRLLRYTRGRKLFCCSGDSATDCYTVRNTSAKDVICAMLEYVNIKTHYSVEPHSTTHPTEIIVRCLEDLAQLPECCSDLFGDRHVSTGDKRNPSTSNKNPFDLLFAGLMELAVYQQGDNTEIGPDELEYHKLEGQLRIIQRLVSHQAVRCLLQRSRCSQSNHEGRPLALLSRTIAWLVETLTNQVGPVHQYTETEMPLRAIFMMIQISRGLTTLSSSEKLDEFDHYCDLVIRTYKQLNAVAIRTSQSSEGNQSILKRLCLQLSEYPAGVAHLQRAGLLEECGQTLTDMLTEWDSLPEPRLLGRILTNLTSTRDGMQALMVVGIIKSLISDVWRSVEIGEVSNSSATQLQWDIPSCGSRVPTWSTDPIDRIAYKPFVRLVRATCSYAGLDALLNDAAENQSTTYGRRFTPTSLQEFFQRTLSIPNDKNQSQSLYNVEETIVLALRLLSCMVSDLNVMLALECRFRLIDGLLKDHRDAVTSNESLQLDAVTIERNYLLVKCNVIGGPDERRIPPRSLCEHLSNPYPYPIIINELDEETAAPFDRLTSQQYPVTSCIKSPCFPWYAQLYPSDPVSTRLDEFSTLSLSVFYSNALFNKPIDSKSVAEEWYRTCLASLVSSASTEKLANSCVKSHDSDFGDFLENLSRCYKLLRDEKAYNLQSLSECLDPEALNSVELGEQDMLGIKLTVRYGQRLGMLKHERPWDVEKSPHVIALCSLLKQVQWSFKQGISKANADGDGSRSKFTDPKQGGEAPWRRFGFDWFTATIFIGFRGNFGRCWEFLSQFASDPRSVYLWPVRGQYLMTESSDPCVDLFRLRSCQFLEHLLALECPNVYNAFLMVELPPSQIFSRWNNQCFWNYLNWNQIVDRLVICLLNPPSYHIYFGVTVFRHLSKAISQAMVERPTEQQHQPEQLIIFLQEEPIRGFDVQRDIAYMDHIHNRYEEQLGHLLIPSFPS
ncbi:Protein broad-minded [Clonorchis sinensis]|uniref:Protein broad-minded n=1 Tax=Clonorchis sinensis TaxID=79923 RepID=A0A8T1N0Q4_CLOSI|nr:Protein broad-minded [Clonorchis sinensis]